MNTFLVTYDNSGVEEHYSGLITQLADVLAPSCQILDGIWLLRSNHTAQNLYRLLAPHMLPNGGLLIAQLRGSAMWAGFDGEVDTFIREAL